MLIRGNVYRFDRTRPSQANRAVRGQLAGKNDRSMCPGITVGLLDLFIADFDYKKYQFW